MHRVPKISRQPVGSLTIDFFFLELPIVIFLRQGGEYHGKKIIIINEKVNFPDKS